MTNHHFVSLISLPVLLTLAPLTQAADSGSCPVTANVVRVWKAPDPRGGTATIVNIKFHLSSASACRIGTCQGTIFFDVHGKLMNPGNGSPESDLSYSLGFALNKGQTQKNVTLSHMAYWNGGVHFVLGDDVTADIDHLTCDGSQFGHAENKQAKGGWRDLGGGILKDGTTGLEWTQNDNGHGVNWDDAKGYCQSKAGGWRLPSEDELAGIRDEGDRSGDTTHCGDYTCKVSSFFHLTYDEFWSGTKAEGDPDRAWGVSLFRDTVRRETFVVLGNPANRALCVRHP